MKNTTLKILGLVLTLAMLSGLILAAVPASVSAADLSWSNVTLPTFAQNTSANVYTFTGDGKTIYLWTAGDVINESYYNDSTNNTKYPMQLFKSADGGMTWSNSSMDTTTPPVISSYSGGTVTIKQLAVNPDNTNDIIACGLGIDGNYHVYRSINAGNTFYVFDPGFTAGNIITSLDVRNGSSGLVSMAVGFKTTAAGAITGGGVGLFDSSTGTWRTTNAGTLGNNWNAGDACLSVKFSPNYANDGGLLAVAASGTAITVRGMIVATGSVWNDNGGIKDAVLKQTNIAVTATGTTVASMAIPSDFVPSSNTQNRVYVGLGNSSADDVYRVNGGSSTASTYALGANNNISSVAYTGTASSGLLVAGLMLANTGFPYGAAILSTTQVTANSPTWNTSANNPSGKGVGANGVANVKVKFLPGSNATTYTLYAGTEGANSELASSTDANSFWGQGMYSVASFNGVKTDKFQGLGGQTVLLYVKGGSGASADAMLFKSADGGATWDKILDNDVNGISFSAIRDFSTIYCSQSGAGNAAKQILKSSDGGATWTILNTPGNVNAVSISAVDANSYWIGSTDRGIQNSSSSTYAAIDGRSPRLLFNFPGMFVVQTDEGDVYLSTDSGATFNRLGDLGQFNGTGNQVNTIANGPPPIPPDPITFNVPGKVIYIVDLKTHNIMSWTVGTDSTWQIYLNATQLPSQLQNTSATANGATLQPISNINIAFDGLWYIVSNNNLSSSTVNGATTYAPQPQIWYSQDPKNYTFTPLFGTDVNTIGGIFAFPYWTPSNQAFDASKNSVLYAELLKGSTSSATGAFTQSTGAVSLSPNGFPMQISAFTNSLSTAPKPTAPVDKSTVGTPLNSNSGAFAQVNFSWPAVSYTGAKYQFQVAFDKDFNSIVSAQNNAMYKTFASKDDTSGTNQSLLDLAFIPSNTVSAVPLLPGQTYYWRERVDYPVYSKWSDPIQFSTVVVSVNQSGIDTRLSPVNGATSVSVTPVLTWGTVSGATGYDFKIGTDPTFATTMDAKSNINTTVYAPSGALKPNTTYYWEVRALNGTAAGDWVISAFTTSMSAQGTSAPAATAAPPPVSQPPITVVVPPASQAPITVVVPTQPVQPTTTPPYIWVIIAIGAILVIAVIVLIARTRRV